MRIIQIQHINTQRNNRITFQVSILVRFHNLVLWVVIPCNLWTVAEVSEVHADTTFRL